MWSQVLLVLGAVWATDVCISIDVSGVGCSTCKLSEDGFSQTCYRGEKWLTCYRSIEQCCDDPTVSVPTEECVARFVGSTCSRYVSRDATRTNAECQDQCRKIEAAGGDLEELEGQCMYEHFEVDEEFNVSTSEGSCFNNWVHGYADLAGEPLLVAGYDYVDDVETPALCQALCQEDSKCVRFLWSSDRVGAGENDRARRCHKKMKDQITIPVSIIYTEDKNPRTYEEMYCDTKVAHMCWTGTTDCAPCTDQQNHCVWKSPKHISGWKYCPDTDTCQLRDYPDLTYTTTLAPPTTTTYTEVATITTAASTIMTTTLQKTTEAKDNTRITVAKTTQAKDDTLITVPETTQAKDNTRITIAKTTQAKDDTLIT
ncbi:hypothetical protein GNI_009570, partial [Gregarina niphandrodes]